MSKYSFRLLHVAIIFGPYDYVTDRFEGDIIIANPYSAKCYGRKHGLWMTFSGALKSEYKIVQAQDILPGELFQTDISLIYKSAKR